MDEIRNLKRSIKVVRAKASCLREGFDALEKAVKEMNNDMDAFKAVHVKDL